MTRAREENMPTHGPRTDRSIELRDTIAREARQALRSIGRSPASGSTMLRSPKEIVTASKVLSAKGSRVPSPAVKGSCGRACLPTRSIPIEKSHGTTTAPRSANGSLDVPVPAARSSTS